MIVVTIQKSVRKRTALHQKIITKTAQVHAMFAHARIKNLGAQMLWKKLLTRAKTCVKIMTLDIDAGSHATIVMFVVTTSTMTSVKNIKKSASRICHISKNAKKLVEYANKKRARRVASLEKTKCLEFLI